MEGYRLDAIEIFRAPRVMPRRRFFRLLLSFGAQVASMARPPGLVDSGASFGQNGESVHYEHPMLGQHL